MFEAKFRALSYTDAQRCAATINATIADVEAHVEMSPYDDRTYNVVVRQNDMR